MKKIKIECNGPGRHINDVDLKDVLKKYVVLRKGKSDEFETAREDIPERLVLKCRECPVGEVIITRDVILENI